MDGGFFERYGSGLKENIEEQTAAIKKEDQLDILDENELAKIFEDTASKTVSYTDFLSSLLELNVSCKNTYTLSQFFNDILNNF